MIPPPSLSRALEHQLLNLSSDAIMVLDYETNRIEFWNDGAENVYGYTAAEAIGHTTFELIHTRFPAPLEEIKVELKRRRAWAGELVHRTRHGRIIHVASRMFWYESGGQQHFFEINRDITVRFESEAAVAELNCLLEQRNHQVEALLRTRERFIATLSHELRTPLNSILGFSSLLRDSDGAWSEKQRRFVGHIESSGLHLLRLLNEMLDLAHIDAGRLSLHPERVSLVEAEQAALSDLEPAAQRQQVALSLDPQPELWVWADAARLRQILYNLLSNAIKFTPAGGRVWVGAAARGDQVELVVGDTGVGIQAEDQSAAFEEFWQATQAGPQSGAGLGLAITRRLVSAQGGTIRVESEVGCGSRFYVTLPVAA